MEINYNTSINSYLIYLRESKGLNRKELAKELHLRRITLFNLERGYLKINDKIKNKYAVFFDIDINVFDKLNEVPESIRVEENSMKHLFSKKFTLIFSFILSLITLITSITCYNVRQERFQNPRNYVTENYYNLYDKALSEETVNAEHSVVFSPLTLDLFLMRTDYMYYKDSYEYSKDGISIVNSIYYGSSESKSIIFSISTSISDGEDSDILTIKLNYRGGINNKLKGTISLMYSSTYDVIDCNIYYSQNKGLYLGNGLNYEVLNQRFETYKSCYLESLDSYFKANTEYDTINYLNSILPSISSFSISTVVLFYVYLICSLIFVGSIFTFLVSIFSLVSDRIKYNETEYNKDYEKDKLTITKNKWISPFIKEGYIKIIGVILITISNFALLFYYTKYLNRLDFGVYLESDTLKRITNITRIGSIALVAVTCKTYTKDIYSYRKTALFLLFGLWFYVLEYFFIKRAFESNILIEQFKSYIPTNFFLAIFLLLLISLFLYKTPKHCDTKAKLCIFRGLSVIPVLLFILSYTLKQLDMNGVIDLPLEVELIIPQKIVGVELFGVIYLYSMFTYDAIIKKKHGVAYLNQYKYTNTYYWICNLIICIILVIITIIEHVPFFSEQLSSIGIGKLKYAYLLIFLFSMYHPRIEKPNSIQNILYALSFLISIIIPYLLIAYQVMYFIML